MPIGARQPGVPFESGAPGSYEVDMQADHEQKLAELLTMPLEDVAELRPLFQETATRAIDGCLAPHDRESMALSAGIVDWSLFGTADSPLPDGLVWHQQSKTHPLHVAIGFDNTRVFGQECFDDSLERLSEDVLEAIRLRFADTLDSREEAIVARTRAIIVSSPAFDLVQSFAALPPRSVEKPLSVTERAQREAAIDRSYKLDHTTRRTDADRRAQREKARLDDETVRRIQPAPHSDDVKTRARAFFAEHIFAHATDIDTRVSPAAIEAQYPEYPQPDDAPNLRLRSSRQGDISEDLQDALMDATQALLYDHDPIQRPATFDIQHSFLNAYAGFLFDERNGLTYEQVVEHAILSTEATYASILGAMSYGYTDPRNMPYMLRRIQDPIVPYEMYLGDNDGNRPTHDHNVVQRITISTEAELEASAKTQVGSVLQGDTDNGSLRVILQQPGGSVLPTHHPDEVLKISMPQRAAEGSDIYIPGYTLTSKHDDQYGFVHDIAGDPHEAAPICMPHDNIDELMQQYDAIGFSAVADMLRAGEVQTVQELVTAIREQSVYPRPYETRNRFVPDALPADASATSVFGFDQYMEGGKLNVQCSGAARFLQHSLNTVYGTEVTTIISGHVLPFDDKITGMKHAQVVFSHQGQVAVFDATAPDALGAPSQPGGHRAPSRTKRLAYQPSRVVLPHPAMPETVDTDRSGRRQLGLVVLRSAVEAQFGHILQMPNRETFYKHVVGLPKSDPLRYLLEATIHIGNDDNPEARASQTARYLAQYQSAPPATRRRWQHASYEPSMLQLLARQGHRLDSLVTATADEA